MGFARSVDHLDGDEISFSDFVVPRPHSSVLFRVRDSRLAAHAILSGDVIVVERDQPLRDGRIALVNAGGEVRLARVYGDGSRFTFDELPDEDVSVELLGIASRIIRPLLP
ncbi:MAG TPA: S24 family peptidase [Thermoanaerobaculia bacterium]